jgi:hypothetical protein
LVASVLADVESSQFDDRHKALFRFIDKVNHSSPAISGGKRMAATGYVPR